MFWAVLFFSLGWSWQTERTKNEELSENMSFNGETVWKFQTEKIKNYSLGMENKTKEPQDPWGKNWTWTM